MCLKNDKMFNFGLSGFVFLTFVCLIGVFFWLQWASARLCVCGSKFTVCMRKKVRVNEIKSYCLQECLCTFMSTCSAFSTYLPI